MRLLKKAVLKLIYVYNSIRWFFEYYRLRKTPNANAINIYEPEARTVVIVPHADDELFGTFGFINKNKASTCLFYCGFTGENKSDKNKRIRQREFESLCEAFCFQYHIAKDFHQDLIKIIEEFKPEQLLLPSFIDWHEEHRLTNQLALDVLTANNLNINILWYTITVPIISDNALILPMSKYEQNIKYDTFKKFYISQSKMPLNRFRYSERVAARFSSFYSVETYLRISLAELMIVVGSMEAEEIAQQLHDLRFSIGNLISIREFSSVLYQKLLTEENSVII